MTEQSAMHIIIGAPVTGNDFYPRNQVVDKVKKALQNEHVLFLAPRRTGKTSVLLRLQQVAPAQAIVLDLEGFDHPGLWIKAMACKLGEITDPAWLHRLKQKGEFVHRFKSEYMEITEANWEEKADKLLQDLHGLDEAVWFLLDEFPIMIDKIAKRHGAADASAVLHWLRRSRQENVGSPVRFLLTGSIGLDSVLRRHNIRGPANDLRRETLTPLGADEALELALKLAHDNSIPLNEALAREYIDRLGPAIWPYFIQLFVAELQDHDPDPNHPADLEAIYRSVTHGNHNRNQYSDNMWERLQDIFNPAEAATARALLKTLAAQDSGVELEQLRTLSPLEDSDFFYVLDVLQHDGYLIEDDGGRLRFFSHLLRDYWRRRGRV